MCTPKKDTAAYSEKNIKELKVIMKPVANFRTEQEAEIAALRLKELGIQHEVVKSDGGPFPSMTDIYGYTILADGPDTEAAKKALESKTYGIQDTEESPKTESVEAVPVSSKWLMYGGFAIGIIVGCSLLWGYLSIKRYMTKFDRTVNWDYSYRDVLMSMQDRNKDGKWDTWVYWDGNITKRGKYDNNFDGEPDVWYERIRNDSSVNRIDFDWDGKPDGTCEMRYEVPLVWHSHPGDGPTIRDDYYQDGILAYSLLDTDSSGCFDTKREYDRFGNILGDSPLQEPGSD